MGMVRWRNDGKELYFIDSSADIVRVSITTSPEFKAGAPETLFHAPPEFPLLQMIGQQVDVTPDGQRFMFLLQAPAGSGAGANSESQNLETAIETLQRTATVLNAANASFKSASTDKALNDVATAIALTKSAIAYTKARPEAAGAAPAAALSAGKPDFFGQRARGQRPNIDRALDGLSTAYDQLARAPGGDLGGLRQQIADSIVSAAQNILAGAPAGRG
jgi:hypothetical protein